MPRFTTPLQSLVSASDTTGTWNPLTEGINTADLKEVRFRLWFDAVDSIEYLLAYQMSDDGVTWSSSYLYAFEDPATAYATPTNAAWAYGDGSYLDITRTTTWYSGGPTPTPRLFVRFGVFLINTSGSATQGAQCKMVVESKPLQSATRVFGPLRVNTAGSNSTWVFHPMSGPVPTERLTELRMTIEMAASSGDVDMQGWAQTTDDPSDPSSWTDWASGTITSTLAADGLDAGTTFTEVPSANTAENWIRYGVRVKNTSSSGIEAAVARLRVDER